MFLAGDIGGTKTNLAFFRVEDGRLDLVVEGTYSSRHYPELDQILRDFLGKNPDKAERVCLGIAGPVRQGRVTTPNLPWVIDAARLQADLGTGPVTLLNDLEANAHGLAALGPDDLVVLNVGTPTAGNAALIAAGTGLGEAGLYWDGRRHHPFASEGGHADFAPRNAPERELATYLVDRFGHVSYERILSGPGLKNVYDFVRRREGREDELPRLMERLSVTDAPAAVALAGLGGQSDMCRDALDLFVSVYGAEAGNLALKMLATGGVYLGGGVAPKLLPALHGPGFLDAFRDKGRMRPLMESMPVRVVRNEKTALLGAARYAAGLHEVP